MCGMMDGADQKNQKLDNQLNLAMELTEGERLRSGELAAGYNSARQAWEVIVKYSGSLDAARALGVQVEEMLNEYAILSLPQELVDEVSSLPQIEYMEKPKRLFFSLARGRAVSCVNPLQEAGVPEEKRLTGRGVLMAVADSGIDYFHEAFRNSDGTTRIAALWDQELGRVFTRAEINEALSAGSRSRALELVPVTDRSGHGTAVAGIAAGSPEGGSWNFAGRQAGIAWESDLLIVKMGNAKPQGFPRTTELMRAVNFFVEQGISRNQPLAVNISFGNTYGPHDGSGLLSTFLDDIGNLGRTTIVCGSGNEGAVAGHVSGRFGSGDTGKEREIRFQAGPYETGFSVQLWKSYEDVYSVTLLAPDGRRFGPFAEELGTLRYRFRETQILVYYGKPGPYSAAQEIYMEWLPDAGAYVPEGEWGILLRPQRIAGGRYDLWLPSAAVLNPATQFLSPTPEGTLTIPSAAGRVITAGAYDPVTRALADFSGRGFARDCGRFFKPDLVAPGTDIRAPSAGGGYEAVTGTSFAAPFVAGAAALLMQWGIVDGNDPFLYGEKARAYLRRGARPLAAFPDVPNPQTGLGALCVSASLP